MMTLFKDQLEKAARYLCAMRGEDPDATVQRSDLWDVRSLCPAWENAAREITAHLQIVEAIEHGRTRT